MLIPAMQAATRPGGFFAGAVHMLQDSVEVESPLPGGIATAVRFIFNQPQWLQLAVLGAATVAGLALLGFAWTRRARIAGWIRSRPSGIKVALAAAAIVLVVGLAAFSGSAWHYTQHDNGFCTGCHIMNPAYARFTESQHSQLECHACHQQSVFASARQLYLWVAERPEAIGPHAKVPNQICANCHVTGQREVWQRIASTAGHRVHLESDSSALRGIQCVTCHGVELHQFQPAARTCGQAGCHESVTITLGKMQAQATSLHCVTCHDFTAEVPALAARDSAAGTLVPGESQCMACHRFVGSTAGFDAAKDPHNGTCGMCHNPHVQRTAADAAKTCASAACHSDWRKEPFHTGVSHRNVANQCTLCHEPHQARVDASNCAGCHQAVSGRRSGRRTITPPLPFDTTAVLRQGVLLLLPGSHRHPAAENHPVRDAPGLSLHGPAASAPADTFPHSRHTSLSCVTCHASTREHGRLTFEPPRGCQICHHQQPARSDCARCHQAAELERLVPVSLSVTVEGSAPRERTTQFDHAPHRGIGCVQCHTEPVSLKPAGEAAGCRSCHDSHHAAGRTCSGCHANPELQNAHRPFLATHTGCGGCHDENTVSRLVPTRSFCLGCHPRRRDHYAARECTTCHFQASPDAFRSQLGNPGT